MTQTGPSEWGQPPPIQYPPPKPRRRPLYQRAWFIATVTIVVAMLIFGACLGGVVMMASTPKTPIRVTPSTAPFAQESDPPADEPADEPATSPLVEQGGVGDTASITSEDGGAAEIKLERVEVAGAAKLAGTVIPGSGTQVHVRLHVTATAGTFSINPNDFSLRKADDTTETYDWMGRDPTIDGIELRAGQGHRGWLSFKAPRAGSVLVYAPNLSGESTFEWALS